MLIDVYPFIHVMIHGTQITINSLFSLLFIKKKSYMNTFYMDIIYKSFTNLQFKYKPIFYFYPFASNHSIYISCIIVLII